MKKTIIIILVSIFLLAFFFLPVISGTSVYQTQSQKKESAIFCASHGCGAIIMISPFKYVKNSLYNIFIRKPVSQEVLDSYKEIPCIPSPGNAGCN